MVWVQHGSYSRSRHPISTGPGHTTKGQVTTGECIAVCFGVFVILFVVPLWLFIRLVERTEQ